MGKLNEYVKANSKWLKLDDGERIVVTYLGYAFALNQNGDKVPCYEFRLENGDVKNLQSQSAVLANFFDETNGTAKTGNKVEITRSGEEQNTRYKVELIINDQI